MRPVGHAVDLINWRVRMARTGARLRLNQLLAMVLVFGGTGIAIGYAVVSRVIRLDDEDPETRHLAG